MVDTNHLMDSSNFRKLLTAVVLKVVTDPSPNWDFPTYFSAALNEFIWMLEGIRLCLLLCSPVWVVATNYKKASSQLNPTEGLLRCWVLFC